MGEITLKVRIKQPPFQHQAKRVILHIWRKFGAFDLNLWRIIFNAKRGITMYV